VILVQEKQQTSASALSEKNYRAEVLPYLDWPVTASALEVNCQNLSRLVTQLRNSSSTAIGLLGTEATNNHLQADVKIQHYLKSTCSSILLKRHCDKILMSTALVKSRGEKQLYLATDFLNWYDPETNKESHAPLILYPVQLYYNNQQEGKESSFVLFVDTQLALENKALLNQLCTMTGKEMPVFSPHNQSEFINQINALTAPLESLTLVQKVALKVLQTNTSHNKPLLSEPYRRREDKNINTEFALELVNNRSIEELRTLLLILEAHGENIFSKEHDSKIFTHKVSQAIHHLMSLGITELSLRHVSQLPEKIQLWIQEIDAAAQTSFIQDCFPNTNSAEFFSGLLNFIALTEKSPSENPQNYHPDHAYTNAVAILQKAKFQYRLIQAEIETLKDHLNLETLPSHDEIYTLCQTLEGLKQVNESVVQPKYFIARKTLSGLFKTPNCNYNEEEELLLKRLLKILRVIELFETNQEYKLSLGSLFNGIQTPWALLEAHVSFSQKLSSTLGSEAVGAQVINHWASVCFTAHENSSVLQRASRASTRLVHLLKIQQKNQLSIDDLLQLAKDYQPSLETLCENFPLNSPLDRLNANSILQLMTMMSTIQDEVHALTSESDIIIYQQKTLATLSWIYNAMEQQHITTHDLKRLIQLINHH